MQRLSRRPFSLSRLGLIEKISCRNERTGNVFIVYPLNEKVVCEPGDQLLIETRFMNPGPESIVHCLAVDNEGTTVAEQGLDVPVGYFQSFSFWVIIPDKQYGLTISITPAGGTVETKTFTLYGAGDILLIVAAAAIVTFVVVVASRR